jgi:hypothetical protein
MNVVAVIFCEEDDDRILPICEFCGCEIDRPEKRCARRREVSAVTRKPTARVSPVLRLYSRRHAGSGSTESPSRPLNQEFMPNRTTL